MKIQKSQPVFGEAGAGCTFTNTGNGIIVNVPNAIPATAHPFKVSNRGKSGEDYKFSVQPGTINGISPEVYDTADLMTKLPQPKGTWVWGGSNYSFVYLECGNTGSPSYAYPETNPANPGYPMVKSYGTQQTSTDTKGFILLASAFKDPQTNKVTVWQYVTGSLWGDRIKVGGNTAQYFFAKV